MTFGRGDMRSINHETLGKRAYRGGPYQSGIALRSKISSLENPHITRVYRDSSQRGPYGLHEFCVLGVGEKLPLGIHCEDSAPFELVACIFRHKVEMQVVPRVAVGAIVDLCRIENGMQRLGNAVDVSEKRIALLVGQRGDLAHVQFGGDYNASAVALLLEKVELGRVKFAYLDPKCGEVFALGAIAAGFHLLGIRQATIIDFHGLHYIKFPAVRDISVAEV